MYYVVEVKEDMTGWVMSEHGVPDSRLTVIKQSEDYVSPGGQHQARWLCECGCEEHNRIVVRGISLKNGGTLSCGCLCKERAGTNFIDMTGWVMSEHGVPKSRLTVIKRAQNGNNGAVMWLCECNCKDHNEVIVPTARLRSGRTLSCGCYALETLIRRNKKDNINGFCDDGKSKWTLLNNTNEKVYYDLVDADEVERHTWYVNDKGYATTTINEQHVTMHQLIGCAGYDHIDRDTLNNRRSNLRYCTQQENRRNSSVYSNNQTGITGVSWSKEKEKWRVSIGIDYKSKHIGYYLNFDDAVKARLQAEAKYFKEFAPQRHLFEQYQIDIENEELNDEYLS